jgi:DNA-binding NarL/FixJ family response regulator
MKLQVLLADDHALFRDGMRYVLQQLSDEIDIICAGNFSETLRQAESNPALDLALLDLDMPGSNGVGSIRIFNQNFPGIPLVVISGSDQRTDIECVMEYGAMGFISKMSSSKIMVSALRVVLGGGVYLPPQLCSQTESVDTLSEPILPDTERFSASANNYGLTKRQLEVLQYLSDGFSNKEMALKMNLAEGTIKVHVAGVFQVLQVSSRLDAVRKAQNLGLITVARESRNGS